MEFEKLLKSFHGDLALHAKLINTFSLMEYIGSRKIIKSQREDRMSDELLSHMAEEVRHAQMLKRLALKMSIGALTSYAHEHLLGGDAGHDYMQTVDRGSSELLGSTDPWHSYICTTWLIEERAMRVYPVYEELLSQLGYGGYLRAILKDEERHLSEVRSGTALELKLTEEQTRDLLRFEDEAFERFMKSVSDHGVGVVTEKACLVG